MKFGSCIIFLLILSIAKIPVRGQERHLFSKHIADELSKDTTDWRYQTAAARYAFVGNYQQALQAWDIEMPPPAYIPNKVDSAVIDASRIMDAKSYIIQQSKSETVIIINEAHHNPKHRTFTTSLLSELYDNGFRYLGLEALNDTIINTRGFATTASGYYIVEPEFGNMVYEALRIGFKIFGYEARDIKTAEEREIRQAENIRDFMQKNKDGKYLIHCGFDHVYEGELRHWGKAMAGRLNELTSIDPYTIDQVRFTERSKKESSHYILNYTDQPSPFVMIRENNQIFSETQYPKRTDLTVFHPITSYMNGRPDWLATERYTFRLPFGSLRTYTYPIQVLAYRSNEFTSHGVPADIVEIEEANDDKALYLREGKYTIIVRDAKYNSIDTFDISVSKTDNTSYLNNKIPVKT